MTSTVDLHRPAPLPPLEHSYAEVVPELVADWKAAPLEEADLVVLNRSLAVELGLDPDALASDDGCAALLGQGTDEDVPSVALAYAGHQFGQYSPRLGDGRALLLGELVDPRGRRVDLHLKGSGRTPFARGGDGKATIGPMLREHVIAEALHALGVPTTRALAVFTTGEQVARNRMEPGAVLVRTAASHLRVGTFEFAVRHGGPELVRRLADHAIDRHHREARHSSTPYRALLAAVIGAQAELVARWMLLGFIHGVMNTDNMTISGEGIDYGPCAFMDRFDPATVFSSIDHGGRYAYANQPRVATWNLARLAETLVPLLATEADVETDEAVAIATGELEGFASRFEEHWRTGMAAKLGLDSQPVDDGLFDDLVTVLTDNQLDLTGTFRLLADVLRGAAEVPDALRDWYDRWLREIDREPRPKGRIAEEMDAVNPVYIPRNHLVHEALEAATGGDFEPYRRLVEVLADPYERRDGLDRYAEAAPEDFTARFRTFCGT